MSAQTPTTQAYDSDQYQHIGAYLRELREHYKLSIPDVAKRLHIRPKYIQALEEGKIEDLPGKVYTLGYLQSYTEFLGLDAEKIISEYHEIKKLDERESFKVMEPHHRQGAPAAKLIIACVVVLLVAFIGWQIFSADPRQTEPEVVEAVPEHLIEQTEQSLVMNERNRLCIKPDYAELFPPCYGAEFSVPPTPFVLRGWGHALEVK